MTLEVACRGQVNKLIYSIELDELMVHIFLVGSIKQALNVGSN